MSSYLHIKSFLGQEKTIELLGGWSPLSCKDKVKKEKELAEEPKSFIHRPDEGTGNDSSFGDRSPSDIYQLQKYPKTSPKDLRRNREVSRAIKAREKA
ncbi:hypothetical protein O181_088142 [Austropuccinia psidii MF-1]|uniref:Uncharacterized protein n=1 Tax=Austropuccinia psidii MF-1 TaxID=1389203 RepID=A0A9Q3IR02_9BASI|nr:hypothetical protein [Austropuccinia psidii MF-1]